MDIDVLLDAAARLRRNIRVPGRVERKVVGSTLCLSVFVYVILLPLALLGAGFSWFGALLKWPLKRLGLWMLPTAVRVWYVHRVGKVHPWQCQQARQKRQLSAHSRSTRTDCIAEASGKVISIHIISQLHDNYAYLLVCSDVITEDAEEAALQQEGGDDDQAKRQRRIMQCALIDVGDADSCWSQMEAIRKVHYRTCEFRVTTIMTTHHHWDHMGGNERMRVLASPHLKDIIGGARDKRVSQCNRYVREGDLISLFDGAATVLVHETPAHTLGSITYRLKASNRELDCMFLGDTCFVGGSGAQFEGDAGMMRDNFSRMYMTNYPTTLLFPGHEYSERIVTALFPEQALELARADPVRFQTLAAQFSRIVHKRSLPHPAPTVPVCLSDETAYNPFFAGIVRASRCLCAAVHVWLRDKEKQSVSGTGVAHGADAPRLSPRVAVAEGGRCTLIEPPWITRSPDRPVIGACAAPTVESGFEIFFHPRRVPTSAGELDELLTPFYMPSKDGLEVCNIAMLEHCLRYPMSTGFPNATDEEANMFRRVMFELMERDQQQRREQDIATGATQADRDLGSLGNDQGEDDWCIELGGPYIRSECLLAFVLVALRASLQQICKIYGKTFVDAKVHSRKVGEQVGLDSNDSTRVCSHQQIGHVLAQQRSFKRDDEAMEIECTDISKQCSTVARVKALRVPYHDFTRCEMCDARAVYARTSFTIPQLPVEHGHKKSADSVLEKKPTVLSLCDADFLSVSLRRKNST